MNIFIKTNQTPFEVNIFSVQQFCTYCSTNGGSTTFTSFNPTILSNGHPINIKTAMPNEYINAVNAIHAATDRADGLNFNKTIADATMPMPITRMPPNAVTKLASCVAKWNWDSRYLGRNVYRPAIGSRCNTEDAVRNIRMSFFKCFLIVFGKSGKKHRHEERKKVEKNSMINIPFKRGGASSSSSWCCCNCCCCSTFAVDLCASIESICSCGAGMRFPRNCFGNANMAIDVMIIRVEIMTKPETFN